MSRSRLMLVLIPPALVLAHAAPGKALAAHPDAWADSSGAWPAALDAHRPGRWSLDFQIDRDFTLSSLKGATLSATRATSTHGAWRLGLDYLITTTRSTAGGLSFGDSVVTTQPTAENGSDQVLLSLVALRLHRFHPARRIGAYFAVGPDLSWNRSHLENVNAFYIPGSRAVLNNYSHQLGFGIDADLGAEVIVARSLGLFAQYGSSGGYRLTHTTLRGQETTSSGTPLGPAAEVKVDSHAWFLNPGNVQLGISLYL